MSLACALAPGWAWLACSSGNEKTTLLIFLAESDEADFLCIVTCPNTEPQSHELVSAHFIMKPDMISMSYSLLLVGALH